jgi:hypothetical protein
LVVLVVEVVAGTITGLAAPAVLARAEEAEGIRLLLPPEVLAASVAAQGLLRAFPISLHQSAVQEAAAPAWVELSSIMPAP